MKSIWHEGLIYKIQSTGVSGLPLILIKSLLSDRFQRVLLNGQSSSWRPVRDGVPQGSILRSLFLLIYINDLSNNLSSTPRLFSYDTSVFSIVHHMNSTAKQLTRGHV